MRLDTPSGKTIWTAGDDSLTVDEENLFIQPTFPSVGRYYLIIDSWKDAVMNPSKPNTTNVTWRNLRLILFLFIAAAS